MSNIKRYEILKNDSIDYKDKKLYRIKAIEDFGDIKKDEIGGYIEKYDNLIHVDNDDFSWIHHDSKVYDNAVIKESSRIFDCAEIFGNSNVIGSVIRGNSKIYENAIIKNSAMIRGNSKIHGDSFITGTATLINSEIYDSVRVGAGTWIENSTVSGNTNVVKRAKILNATVKSNYDYVQFDLTSNVDSSTSKKYITWTRSNNKWHINILENNNISLDEVDSLPYKDDKMLRILKKFNEVVDIINEGVDLNNVR